MRTMFATLVTVWLSGTLVSADPAAVLQPGTRIRVLSTQLGVHPVVGRLTSIDDGVLRLQTDETSPSMVLTRSSIQRLEVSLGMQSNADHGAAAGAWIFGVAGAVLGLFAGAMGNLDCEAHCSSSYPILGSAVGGALGVMVGGGLGAAAGATTKSERWQTVEKRKVQLQLAPNRRGLSAALSIRF